jgi:hypothetical protein
MAFQTIERADPFGRIGKAFGEGLSEQIPKEMEHQRLSSGLQKLADLADQGNLSPAQFLAGAAGTYGATPQIIESFGRLANKQQVRKNLANEAQGNIPQALQAQQDLQQMQGAVQGAQQPPQVAQARQGFTPQEPGAPQINPNNPTRPEVVPRRSDTPAEFQQRVQRHLAIDPEASVDQARQRSVEDMEREMRAPLAQQERDKYLEETQSKISKKLKGVYEKKLQKEGTGVYSDISGDMLVDAERKVDREIAANPGTSVDDVIDRVSTDLLSFAKAKKQLEVLANRPFSSKIGEKEETYKKLQDYGKIYDKFGRNEEYLNYLMTNQDGKGLNISAENAASLAYPITYDKDLVNYINKIKPSTGKTAKEKSRMYALNLEKFLHHPKASILSLLQNIKEKDPLFDAEVFLDQIREDADELELSDRLVAEIPRHSTGAWPNWGDHWIQKPGVKKTFTLKRP